MSPKCGRKRTKNAPKTRSGNTRRKYRFFPSFRAPRRAPDLDFDRARPHETVFLQNALFVLARAAGLEKGTKMSSKIGENSTKIDAENGDKNRCLKPSILEPEITSKST